MNEITNDTCLTCLGAGEVSSERGISKCPDCDGSGKIGDVYLTNEHRIRELEKQAGSLSGQAALDMKWLITELRRCRAALLKVMTAAQDGAEENELFRRIQFEANEALGVYSAKDARNKDN